MQTCRDMFTTLNIGPGELLPCCSALCNFSLDHNAGQFNKTLYLRYLEMMKKRFQQGPSPCDPRCDKLINVPDGRLSPFPTQLAFKRVLINHHRNYCNCRCTYCPFWNVTPKPRLFSVAGLLHSLFAQQVIADGCIFAWGGGESTLLPEFEETVLHLADLGYSQFIHTNAIRYSEAISEVLRRGQAVVNVSLDCGDAASYRKIKGVDAWDKVIANLERYRDALVDPTALELKYIFNKDTAVSQDIIHFFDLCRRLRIGKVLYAFDVNEMSLDPLFPYLELFILQAQRAGIPFDLFVG